MDANSIIDDILRAEGSRYTDDPNDAGGATKYGVTQRTLARYRKRPVTKGEVAALTEDEARDLYRWLYIDEPGYAPILIFAPRIAAEVVDTGVNCGPGRASEWLQRCLNALNRQGRDYADIPVDQDCGPATINALKSFLSIRGKEGETVLLRALNCLQGAHYIAISEGRSANESFTYGWFANRVVI